VGAFIFDKNTNKIYKELKGWNSIAFGDLISMEKKKY